MLVDSPVLGLAVGLFAALFASVCAGAFAAARFAARRGGFFFAPFFFLYDVFAQSAVFAEEAPVNNLKCFFLFWISHKTSFLVSFQTLGILKV